MVDMDSQSEFHPPMSLISSSSQLLPSALADCSSSDLDLGIDLSSIPIEFDIETPFELDNQLIDVSQLEASLISQNVDEPPVVEDRRTSQEEAHFDLSPFLDFDLIDNDVLATTIVGNYSGVDKQETSPSTFAWNEQYEISSSNVSQLNNITKIEQELGNVLGQITPTDVMSVESPGSSDSYDDEDDSSSRHSMETPSDRGLKRTRARTIDKKQSNKVAAVKYRNKKLKERDELFAECDKYASRNAQLRKMIEETQTEISFIKSLLVEALIARNKS